uniref:Uncharacterized protein n=1 Tax=Romanomermis culicivorax TaxID=13658 RepID=A0A915KZG8_ROMCU
MLKLYNDVLSYGGFSAKGLYYAILIPLSEGCNCWRNMEVQMVAKVTAMDDDDEDSRSIRVEYTIFLITPGVILKKHSMIHI